MITIFILIFACIFSLFAALMWGANSPAKAATNFVENISNGNVPQALIGSTQTLQYAASTGAVIRYLSGATHVSFNTIKVINKNSVACGTFLDSNNKIEPLIVYLTKENYESVWKVNDVSFSPDEKCEVVISEEN